jgi:hypothetical protein
MRDQPLNLCGNCGRDADVHGPDGRCFLGGEELFEASRFRPSIGITTRVLMDEQYRVWANELGHADPLVGEEGRPYWRPSSLGYCLRRQTMWRRGIPETRVESEKDEADKLRRFAWGRMIETKLVETYELAGVLISQQVTLFDDDLEIRGNADALWGGIVQTELPARAKYWEPDYAWAVRSLRSRIDALAEQERLPITLEEVKSTHSFAVRKAYKEGPRIDYVAQSGAYFLLARLHPEQIPGGHLDRFELTVIGRDAVRPLCFEVDEGDVRLAEDRIGTLNDFWRRGELPPCTCGQTESILWERNYCPYPNEKGDGCCDTSLADLLEQSLERIVR